MIVLRPKSFLYSKNCFLFILYIDNCYVVRNKDKWLWLCYTETQVSCAHNVARKPLSFKTFIYKYDEILFFLQNFFSLSSIRWDACRKKTVNSERQYGFRKCFSDVFIFQWFVFWRSKFNVDFKILWRSCISSLQLLMFVTILLSSLMWFF